MQRSQSIKRYRAFYDESCLSNRAISNEIQISIHSPEFEGNSNNAASAGPGIQFLIHAIVARQIIVAMATHLRTRMIPFAFTLVARRNLEHAPCFFTNSEAWSGGPRMVIRPEIGYSTTPCAPDWQKRHAR